jgi:hypothetical protein
MGDIAGSLIRQSPIDIRTAMITKAVLKFAAQFLIFFGAAARGPQRPSASYPTNSSYPKQAKNTLQLDETAYQRFEYLFKPCHEF